MLWQRGKAHPQALRERVFAAAEAGLRVGQIAERLLVSISYVSKTLSRERRTGERTAHPQRCHVAPKLASHHDAIRKHVTSNPDITLAELQGWLRDKHNLSASAALICTTVKTLGLTLKKSRCERPSRTGLMLSRHAPSGARSSQALNPAS
jgi:transposase